MVVVLYWTLAKNQLLPNPKKDGIPEKTGVKIVHRK